MEQNIRFIFFIKILLFVLLIWICHLYSDMSRFDKYLDKRYSFCKKLNKRIYLLLGKCENGIFSNVEDLELKIPYNTRKKNRKLLTVNDEKWDKEKKEKLYRSSLYKEKLIKRLMKNKCTMLHKSYNHYEKKIMNGLNDKVFFKKMILINDKVYKKLKRKKYGLRLCLLLLLFIFVLILPILDLSLSNSENSLYLLSLLCQLLGYSLTSGTQPQLEGGGASAPDSQLSSFCSSDPSISLKVSSILVYCIPILIMGIMLIIGIFYYYKYVIKHKKIKSMELFNE
ncbi:Plasmodium exported protein, unknown function [Plasmodium malariae]|uniref:Fam-l protein n=1 Tax=Plasmodium malariae TaxID=5858 RepID=A0A1D3JNA0_PLAMA|nr:Plasmodium exported protein, unknown function [Plasmodium malariae]SBT88027.1 Plasmodium exported protein, unknown function [Plasmodium malariae]